MALITSGCAPFRPTASGPRSSTPPAGWLISRLACRSVVAYSCNPYGEPLLQLYADREWAGFRRRYGAATPRLRQLSARPAASCGGGDRRAPWTSLPGLPSLSDPGHRIFHLRLGLRPMQSSPLSRPAPWTSVVTVARPQRWRGRNGGEAATVARQQRWRGSNGGEAATVARQRRCGEPGSPSIGLLPWDHRLEWFKPTGCCFTSGCHAGDWQVQRQKLMQGGSTIRGEVARGGGARGPALGCVHTKHSQKAGPFSDARLKMDLPFRVHRRSASPLGGAALARAALG